MFSEKVLVIGLGNPILGDDGAGWVVARQVESTISTLGSSVDVDFVSLGGLSLMERMIGYRHVILVDALNTGQHPQGAVLSFTLEEMVDLTYGHASAAHDASIKTALEVGRKVGAILPADKDVHVVAIEAAHIYDFKEDLSPAIATAVPIAVQVVLDQLEQLVPH